MFPYPKDTSACWIPLHHRRCSLCSSEEQYWTQNVLPLMVHVMLPLPQRQSGYHCHKDCSGSSHATWSLCAMWALGQCSATASTHSNCTYHLVQKIKGGDSCMAIFYSSLARTWTQKQKRTFNCCVICLAVWQKILPHRTCSFHPEKMNLTEIQLSRAEVKKGKSPQFSSYLADKRWAEGMAVECITTRGMANPHAPFPSVPDTT